MVISKTPFRVSFFGGGTDYPVWYKDHPGAVLSTTINKYCFITVRPLPPFFDYKYRIRYTNREETKSISEIQHPSVKECLEFLNTDNYFDKGLEILHHSDLPAFTGLGSSSAFTVGLLHALYALKGQMVSKEQLTKDAIHVEQNLIKESVGSQDQTAAAYGGFNKISFGDTINVTPLTIPAERVLELQKHLMIFFTGFSRIASDVAAVQIKETPDRSKELYQMYQLVEYALQILLSSNNIAEFGKLLHETWLLKRSLTNKISNPGIDTMYEAALNKGAIGGKLLGAGGGGCILFFVPPELQDKVKESLKDLLFVPIEFERNGSQIIYFDPSEDF